jgi:D-alanyl-D-alanine carboxypeptidase
MKNLLKRVMALILITAVTCSMAGTACAEPAYPTTVETTAEGYIIYDATDEKIILGKNEDEQFYPASITKIMTALLVLENIEDLDQELTFTQDALDEMTSDSSTLSPTAVVGEKMTVRDALYGMFLISSNECAAQLGIQVAGSTEDFAKLMNARAKEIGCENTHFVNAHGLHNTEHYTTPHDMALIFAEALKNQKFLQMAITYEYEIEPTNKCSESRELKSSHSIVNGTLPYAEVFAGKTGRTPVAGRTLCTAAKFDDHIVLTIIMKSTDDDFYNDTLRLLDYARGYYDGDYTDMTWEEKREKVYVYGTNSLKVRAYPSTAGAKVIGTLQYGQTITRVATWGDWSMIEYMDANYFVCSSYLTTEQPPEEYDPQSAIKETTREAVNIQVSMEETATGTEEDTQEASQSEYMATMGADEEYTRLADLSMDDGSNAIHEGSHGSIIRVIFYVCIVLMIVIAVVFGFISIRERNRRKRRRRRINTDEWYK